MPSCEKALKQVEDIINDNKQNESNPRYSKWKREKDDFQNSKNKQEEWDNCKNNLNCGGNYSWAKGKIDDLRNERKVWNNCAVWDATKVGEHDDWCVNDFGQGWIHVDRGGWGCTAGWGRGECGRTDDKVKKDLDIGERPSITMDPGPWVANPVPDIKCCQDMTFKNMKASDITFNNNSQSCDVAEEDKKSKTSKDVTKKGGNKKEVKPPKELKGSSKGKQKKTLKEESQAETDDSTMYIIIFIVILCLFLLSLSSLAVGLSTN